MVRNVVGAVVALAGAVAAVWSPFRAWYDGRRGRDYRIEDLFNGITDAKAELLGSLLLPFLLAALITLVAALLRSRSLMTLAGLVTLGFTVLWMVRQGQVASGLAYEADGTGLGMGVASALGGGVLMLLGALIMSGRRRGRRRRSRETDPEPYETPGATYDHDPAPGAPPDRGAL